MSAQLLAWDAQRMPLAEQAQRLGIKKGALSARRRRLMQRGAIQPWQRGSGEHWTPEQIHRLYVLVDSGASFDAIARRLKRTRTAVEVKCKRLGIGVTTSPAALSCREVARLLGKPCSKSVTRWITKLGWLKASNAGQPHRPLWRVQWEDLTAFMERREHWMAWDASTITDLALREWAQEIRVGGRWLTPGEVARRLHVVPATPQAWIEKGLLPAVKYGNWWIWSADLVGFRVPGDLPHSTEMHADGLPARILPLLPATGDDLARALGAKRRSVQQALRALCRRGLAHSTTKRGGLWMR
jgi:hypothetical protein